MGDVAELVAVVVIGGFYVVGFIAACAVTELAYVIVEKLRRKHHRRL